MPSEKGVRFHDVQSRLPRVSQPCQKGQSNPVTGCQLGPIDRAVEDNQLLSEHGILSQEICPTARQVRQRPNGESGCGGFGEFLDLLFDLVDEVLAGVEESRQHDMSFSTSIG